MGYAFMIEYNYTSDQTPSKSIGQISYDSVFIWN